MLNNVLKTLVASATAAALISCGGGGSDTSPTPPPAAGHSLSGSILLAETSQVDSDTNDPNQVGRRPNNDLANAQAIKSPVYLIGSVNEAGTGSEDGVNYANGDRYDYFSVELLQGQVVELEFSADPDQNDLDLFIYRQDGLEIGDSVGRNSYECVRIASAGTYYIAVQAFAGASIYNMRIGSPSDTSTCDNSTSGLSRVVPGEVVAKAFEASTSGAQAAKTRAAILSAAGQPAGTEVSDAMPSLLRMPADAAVRARALQRLSALPVSSAASGVTKSLRASTVTGAAAQGDTQHLPALLRDTIDTIGYAKHLERSGAFAYAEANRIDRLKTLVDPYPPNDRLYPNQRWHYEMINMPAAMARLDGLSPEPAVRPLVAVIDSGIVSDHPDLSAQIADQRSFVNSGQSTASADDPSRPGDPTGFHGTHVAGTIAAVTFDGDGVAAVAPMAQLMPIRVFAQGAQGATRFDIAQGILYASRLANSSGVLAARRADVINLSLGGETACPAIYSDAIGKARAAGVVVVAASGNESAAALNTPANCPGVISVGAVDARRGKSYYSNTSASLSLSAPGGDGRVSTTGTGLPDLVFSTLGDFNAIGTRVPSYGGNQGTSMATPHVVGVIALMRYANPAITVTQIDSLLAQGKLTDDIGAVGRDSSFGYGLINARKAVDEALALAGGTPPPPVTGTVVALPSSIDFGALRTSADLELRVSAASTEKVVGVSSSLPAVTVVAKTIDADTKLGTYTVAVDRNQLPLGSSFATLLVTTTTGSFDVQISVQKNPAGAATSADFGQVYVLLVDPDTDQAVAQTSAHVVNGRYSWSFSGVVLTRVQVVAGTDIDNDTLLCQRGEACGAYPQLGASLSVIDLSTNRTGLDFEIVPFGGVSSAASAGAAPRTTYRRRLE